MTPTVIKGARAVVPFIEAVRSAADSDKDALGFLPDAAYSEAAASGKLYVAVNKGSGNQDYIGHVLYGGTFPHIRVFQVYVVPAHRRKRIGSLLIQTLIMDAEADGYLSLSAKVATDLTSANAFWQHEGFETLRCKPGGSSRARKINIRVRELDTPRLFESREDESGLQTANITSVGFPALPSYIIDVNVFLDLMKNRVNAEEVRRLMSASWTRAVDVFVAEEFVDELRRAATPGRADPVLEFASVLPRLPGIPKAIIEPLVATLGPIVFPDKARRNALSQRDTSDLIHIATAIHHGTNGFVTGEKAILKAAASMRQRFGLDVVGTAEFSNLVVPPEHRSVGDLRLGTGGDDLAISEMPEEHRTAAQSFLHTLTVPDPLITAALSPGAQPRLRRRIEVRSAATNDFVGFASWDSATRFKNHLEAYVFVDDDHPDARAIAAHLFRETLAEVSTAGPSVALLRTPEGHVNVRAAAVEAGFRATEASPGSAHELRKIAIGGVVTRENWTPVSHKLKALTGLELPTQPPAYEGPATEIAFVDSGGSRLTLRLMDVERLLGPTVLLLPGRFGALVPIRREYADHLFSGSMQLSLLPRRQAALFSERAYFRSPDRARIFSVGTPLVFYESLATGGRGCAFVSAVVTTNRIVWTETLSDRVLLKGVLDRQVLEKMSRNGMISMLKFNNTIALRKPVGLSRLRDLKAIDGANLVSPRRLDVDTLRALFSEADALAL